MMADKPILVEVNLRKTKAPPGKPENIYFPVNEDVWEEAILYEEDEEGTFGKVMLLNCGRWGDQYRGQYTVTHEWRPSTKQILIRIRDLAETLKARININKEQLDEMTNIDINKVREVLEELMHVDLKEGVGG